MVFNNFSFSCFCHVTQVTRISLVSLIHTVQENHSKIRNAHMITRRKLKHRYIIFKSISKHFRIWMGRWHFTFRAVRRSSCRWNSRFGDGTSNCRLVAATNKNGALHDFLQTRTLKRKSETRTVSPSMDICVPYNVWRMLYTVCPQSVGLMYKSFEKTGNLCVR